MRGASCRRPPPPPRGRGGGAGGGAPHAAAHPAPSTSLGMTCVVCPCRKSFCYSPSSTRCLIFLSQLTHLFGGTALANITAEYIWIDGQKPTAKLRSKTKIIDGQIGR